MAEILKPASIALGAFVVMAGEAMAAQGPGVADGTATAAEKLGLGAGVFALLLTGLFLARRSKR